MGGKLWVQAVNSETWVSGNRRNDSWSKRELTSRLLDPLLLMASDVGTGSSDCGMARSQHDRAHSGGAMGNRVHAIQFLFGGCLVSCHSEVHCPKIVRRRMDNRAHINMPSRPRLSLRCFKVSKMPHARR